MSLLVIAIFFSNLPFLWLFTQTSIMGDSTSAFANIAGLLGVVLMLWQVVLGNRFIARHVSQDYVKLVKLHIFLGIYGFFLMMTHPFLEMIVYTQDFAWLFLPDLGSELGRHVALGQVAIYLYLVLWISSALTRGRISYRFWKYLHYLSYPVLLFAFVHAVEIGTFLNNFLLLKIYFLALLAVFVTFIFYRLSQLLDVGKFPYVLLGKKTSSTGISTYSFRPLVVKLIPEVGQFFFIKPNLFAESHPFTVMNFDEKTGKLVFGIKVTGKFTNQLELVSVGQTVFLDGPYGVFTREAQNDQLKVIIAGGIGITPFVELIARFGIQNTKLFYANQYLRDAVMREQLKTQLGDNYLDVVSREKVSVSSKVLDKSVIEGRIDVETLRQHLSPEFLDKANFFICGSSNFMGGILTILKQLEINKKRIFVEEFSF